MRNPCLKTIGLLLQSGADVDDMDSARNTPLHLIVQRKIDSDSIIPIIDLLCDNAGAHLDCVNDKGQTPLEAASDINVERYFREKIGIRPLKCLCARLIQKSNIRFQNYKFPLILVNFIQKH